MLICITTVQVSVVQESNKRTYRAATLLSVFHFCRYPSNVQCSKQFAVILSIAVLVPVQYGMFIYDSLGLESFGRTAVITIVYLTTAHVAISVTCSSF